MKTSGLLITILVLGVIAVGAVSAFGGFGNREQVRAALDANDYTAWKQAMESGLTQERFEQMKQKNMRHVQDIESRQAMRKAIENADYDGWKTIVEGMEPTPFIAEKILTQEDFNTLVEIHQARQNKDFDRVSVLQETLGLKRTGMGKGRFGCMGE
ncbi:MAG: hypothetical protein ABIG95_07245 [Candidatus Woesearchaeota archaeon]